MMELQEVIEKRRALRTLGKVEITCELITRLAATARLAASCNNNQPWRYIFVYDSPILNELFESLSPGNYWAKKASLMIAVMSKKDLDCVIGKREYYLFDTGMATAHLLLKATELGLVAHPMAGFNPEVARKVLNIPDIFDVITLIAVGKHEADVDPGLAEKHAQQELQRPPRREIDQFVFLNRYSD
jgi:nitroreductase